MASGAAAQSDTDVKPPAEAQADAGANAAPAPAARSATADPLIGLMNEDLTVEETMERLRQVMGSFSPLGPAGDAVVTDAPTIRRGDLIIAAPVAPRRVGRLGSDLIQTGGLIGRGRVLMPAGTPVYYTRFRYTVTYNYTVITNTEYEAWCGVVTEERGRRSREVGYCALIAGGLRQVSTAVGGSPYWPRTLDTPVNASFTIVEDQGALAEFPRLELTYTFVEFDEEDADVRRGVRVNNGEVIEISNVSLARRADGASLLRAAGGELLVHRTDRRREARVEVLTAPDAYSPDEEEAQLRLIAELIVQRRLARQAAAAAAPAPATPPAQ